MAVNFRMILILATLVIGAAANGAVAQTTQPSAPDIQSAAPREPSLAEVRAATERFRDVKVALAEGYLRDPMNLCDTADMMGQPAELGAMGIHFFRPDRSAYPACRTRASMEPEHTPTSCGPRS